MRKFSKQVIDEWREKFVERGYPQESAIVDQRSIDYFVLPVRLFQGIPNGLFRMTGEKSEGYLVGVSEEVNDEIKPHFAMSEHDEFMVYGLEDLDRTLHSEQNMVRVLNNTKLCPVYVDGKIALYRTILDLSRGNLETWGFEQADYEGFDRALEFLKSMRSR